MSYISSPEAIEELKAAMRSAAREFAPWLAGRDAAEQDRLFEAELAAAELTSSSIGDKVNQ